MNLCLWRDRCKLVFMDIAPNLTDTHEYALLVGQLGSHENKLKSHRVLAQLEQAAAFRAASNDLVARLLDEAAKHVAHWGTQTTWEMVGNALGVSPQAASQAHKRWKAAQK